jgi:DNA helicase-2/ATP-dependent DNA helicase PcrA
MFPYRNQEPRNAEEMEEERRLAYVAVTRARQHLVITHVKQRQVFGTTRLGVPSRFVGDLPSENVEHLETPAARASGSAGRWIDRGGASSAWRSGASGSASSLAASPPPRGVGWRHPQASSQGLAPTPPPPPRNPGERYVEYDQEALDSGHGGHGDESGRPATLRRGMTVVHERFGRGEVRDVVNAGEPAVVAFFPGWGEKKVLARFLRGG